jgi:hypothetical protein
MAMPDLDKAARYLAKQDPPGFFTWLCRRAVSPLRFHTWYDARRLAQPDEEDRTCDTVAAFRLLNATAPTHFLIVDFKDQARAGALDQLHDYVVRLSRELRREMRPAPQVGGAVINLTGKPKPRSVTVDFPGVPECAWHFGILQRSLREEVAAETVADIRAGRTTRWLLAWGPLMQGGRRPAIIGEWKQAALAEPDVEVRATLGSLTLVFAELAKCAKVWQTGLKGWNMQTSKIVEEWREEGRLEGRLELARETLQAQLTQRFGKLPKAWSRRIETTTDLARLKAALLQVGQIDALNELQL